MRRVTSAALALALAGGVYFASPAQASNMGFKLERSFSFVDGGRNVYLVSFPLFNGLADISDGSQCLNPGDPGDDIINAADALCDFFTNRTDSNGGATMAMQWLDTSDCSFKSTLLTATGPGGAHFIFGSFTNDLTDPAENFREIGYFVNISKDEDDPSLENRAVIVGSHDPSWGGHTFSIATGCGQDMINMPYHTMFRTVDELLCGLEGVDWMDGDGDGAVDVPATNSWIDVDGDGTADPCPNGLYDPASGVAVSIQRFINAPGQFSESRLVTPGAGLILGPAFELTPGDGYLTSVEPGFSDRQLAIPHF